jgi:hypothetical protein
LLLHTIGKDAHIHWGWSSLNFLMYRTDKSPSQHCMKRILDKLQSHDHWKSSIKCWIEL